MIWNTETQNCGIDHSSIGASLVVPAQDEAVVQGDDVIPAQAEIQVPWERTRGTLAPRLRRGDEALGTPFH
jgi:hypothetical protein